MPKDNILEKNSHYSDVPLNINATRPIVEVMNASFAYSCGCGNVLDAVNLQVQEAETPVLPVLLWDFPGD